MFENPYNFITEFYLFKIDYARAFSKDEDIEQTLKEH